MSTATLTPPQDMDAEMALLGSMLASAEAVEEARALIPTHEIFYLPAHRLIYGAIIALHEDGVPIDMLTLKDTLERRGHLELSGGVEYMVRLAESFCDTGNVAHYARLVRTKWQAREMIRIAQSIIEETGSPVGVDIGALCSSAIRRMDGVLAAETMQAIERMEIGFEAALDESRDIRRSRLSTGIVPLDDIGGLPRPGMVIVAGRPSKGKTVFGGFEILYGAARSGTPMLMASLEMSMTAIRQRMVCALSGETLPRIREMKREEAIAVAQRAVRGAIGTDVYVIGATRDLNALIALIRLAVRKHGIGGVVVDYIQLIRLEGKWQNANERMAEISGRLKNLSMDLQITIIVLSQYNREAEGRDSRNPPDLDQLRDSGTLEQDADMVISLYPYDWFDFRVNARPAIVVDVQKNRQGPLVRIDATFDKAQFRILFGVAPLWVSAATRDDGPF